MRQADLTEVEWKDLRSLLGELQELKPERRDVIAPLLAKLNGLWYKANPWAAAQPPKWMKRNAKNTPPTTPEAR